MLTNFPQIQTMSLNISSSKLQKPIQVVSCFFNFYIYNMHNGLNWNLQPSIDLNTPTFIATLHIAPPSYFGRNLEHNLLVLQFTRNETAFQQKETAYFLHYN